MLGYSSSSAKVVDGYTYGNNPSGGSYILDNLACDGSESSVFDCQHNGEWEENCGSTEMAGVQCEGKYDHIIFFIMISYLRRLRDFLGRILSIHLFL